MSERARTFRDLDVWQSGMELAVSVYELAGNLPPDERFELARQLRRAAVSIPSNVAEGNAFRSSPRMYRRHVRIALGSFAELETQIELAARLGLVSHQPDMLMKQLTRTGQLLHGLLRALRAIKSDERES